MKNTKPKQFMDCKRNKGAFFFAKNLKADILKPYGDEIIIDRSPTPCSPAPLRILKNPKYDTFCSCKDE